MLDSKTQITKIERLRELLSGASLIAQREIRDQLRDWRILVPIVLLTLFFPVLMNFTANSWFHLWKNTMPRSLATA